TLGDSPDNEDRGQDERPMEVARPLSVGSQHRVGAVSRLRSDKSRRSTRTGSVCDTTSHRRGSCLAHHSPGDPATQRRGPLLRLVTWWFGPHAIEHAGAIYRPLGVRQAKQLLMATLGRVFRGANYSLEGRDRESLRRFERWTIVNESYHLAW